MKIGFTGTRLGMKDPQAEAFDNLVIKLFYESGKIREFHHGDCIGADKEARDLVSSLAGVWIHCHPCNLEKFRAYTKYDRCYEVLPPIKRNKSIVDATDILIACPGGTTELHRGSGTWSTIRYARSQHKKIYIVYPDGVVKEEDSL